MTVRYVRPTAVASCRRTSAAFNLETSRASCACQSFAQAAGASRGTVSDRLPFQVLPYVVTTLFGAMPNTRSPPLMRVYEPLPVSVGSQAARASRTSASARLIS